MVDKELIDVLSRFRDDIKADIKADMDNFKNEIRNDMENFKNEIRNDMNNFKDEIRNDMENFKNEIRTDLANFKDEVYTKFNVMNNDLKTLKNTVLVMEHEHGEKLAILLDYASGNTEKHEQYNKEIELIKSRLSDHDVKISVLKDMFEKAKNSKGKEKFVC